MIIDALIGGITAAINTEFGDAYRIYTESVQQDLAVPCFFVRCIDPANELFFGDRYQLRNQFVIEYFPESEYEQNAELNEVFERLNHCLEYISITGDLLHGTDADSSRGDGTLQYFINYNFFGYRRDEKERMGELEQKHKTG